MSDLSGFAKIGRVSARNPLGIVALFLFLVYGLAGLTLGVSGDSLEASERELLVWFLVLFPVVILATFFRLVTAHHTKLYAPHDYPDGEGFFRALTPSEQDERLERNLATLITSSLTTSGRENIGEPTHQKRMEALSANLTPRQIWLVAEDYAIRRLRDEFGEAADRRVAIECHYGVDAVFFEGDRPIFVQVMLAADGDVRRCVDQIIEDAAWLSARNIDGKLILAAVSMEDLSGEQVENEVAYARSRAVDVKFPVDVRVYNFPRLKKHMAEN